MRRIARTDSVRVDNNIKIDSLIFEGFASRFGLFFSFFCEIWIIGSIAHFSEHISFTFAVSREENFCFVLFPMIDIGVCSEERICVPDWKHHIFDGFNNSLFLKIHVSTG